VWPAAAVARLDASGGSYALTLTQGEHGVDARLDVTIQDRAEVGGAGREAVRSTLNLTLDADLPCEIVSTGLQHLIVPAADETALSALKPSRADAEALGARFGVE
jgi:predicted PhzF superfamily epimerase YddE/YHI9